MVQKLREIYKPSKEELVHARENPKADEARLQSERDEKSVKIKMEERLKVENEHVAKYLNWTQLNEHMQTHV